MDERLWLRLLLVRIRLRLVVRKIVLVNWLTDRNVLGVVDHLDCLLLLQVLIVSVLHLIAHN